MIAGPIKILVLTLLLLNSLTAHGVSKNRYNNHLAQDNMGHIYTTSWKDSKIRKYNSHGSLLNEFNLPLLPGHLNVALTINWQHEIFVISRSIKEKNTRPSVWKITSKGEISKLTELEIHAFPSDITTDHYGNLYVSDSKLGKIYKISALGVVENWLQHTLLTGDGTLFGTKNKLGAKGIVFRQSHSLFSFTEPKQFLYIANADRGMILKIAIHKDGSANKNLKVLAQQNVLLGVDGVAFNHFGQLYAAIRANQTIVKLNDRGKILAVNNNRNNQFLGDLAFGSQLTPYIANAPLVMNANPIDLIFNASLIYRYTEKESGLTLN